MIKSIVATDDSYRIKMRVEDLPEDAWRIVTGNRETDDSTPLAIVRKCSNYRTQSIKSIPWKLVNRSGDTVTDSTEFTDAYPQITSVIKSLTKIERSLIATAKAFYYIPESRVLDPRSITVNWDREYGIVSYTRKIGNEEITLDVSDMVYVYEESIGETEPGKSIFDTIAINSKVLKSIDTYITQYFDNGTIKATILTTKDNSYPTKEESDKVENFLNRSVRGLKNAFRSIFLRMPVEATVVGSGLENFDPTLHSTETMSIITAFEVPPSGVLPSAANYATAISDKRQYYEVVAIPRLDYIFDAINEQWLMPMGLRLQSEGEKLPLFQEDESQRSQSLANLVNAGFDVLDAADILGYTIPDDIRQRLLVERQLMPEMSSFVFSQPQQLQDSNGNQLQPTGKTYLFK